MMDIEDGIPTPEVKPVSDQEIIERIVDDHSGGIKLTELLVAFMTYGSKGFPMRKPGSPDEFLQKIGEIPGLHILRYHMRLGEDAVREKYFIYRKVGE